MMDELSLFRRLYPFPSPRRAPGDGPLAIGGELSTGRLLSAYSQGIFPWYDETVPVLWWSPDPRFVLFPEELHVPRKARRQIRGSDWTTAIDSSFSEVIRRCARAPRAGQEGTWITEDMIVAYEELHRLGYAHSVEVRRGTELVGGLYGVALGRAFFGESMFHLESGASKAALVELVTVLESWGYTVVDCQQTTELLGQFGAREISRSEFLDHLDEAMADRPRSPWVVVGRRSPG